MAELSDEQKEYLENLGRKLGAGKNPEDLSEEEKRKAERWTEQLNKVKRVSQAAQIGAELAGQRELGQAFGDVGDVAHAGAEGGAGAARRAGANIAGRKAGRIAQKKYGAGGGKAAALGGAVAGALRGEGMGDVAKTAVSWYLLWIAFASLFTVLGSIPALIYLDFHFVMSKFGSKLFGEMFFWQKIVLAFANVLVVVLVLLVFTPFIVIPAMCQSDTAAGTATRVFSTAGRFYLTPFGDFCSAFSSIGDAFDRGRDALCESQQELARQNNTPYPIGNDPDLDRLVSCIEGRVGNVGSKFTFDQMHGTCNYTRGVETCEFCSHSVNSCHYGGRTGRTGSLAVDFGGRPGGGQEGEIGPQILQAARSCSVELRIGLNRSTCENGQGRAVACADRSADHIHISLEKCDKDNGPLRTE